jgi:hypothetical protein
MQRDFPLNRPLENETYTRVLIRVSYRLIVMNYRKYPERYTHPPTGILILAEYLRTQGFGLLYFYLLTASKWVASGGPLREWADLQISQGARALHKRKLR